MAETGLKHTPKVLLITAALQCLEKKKITNFI